MAGDLSLAVTIPVAESGCVLHKQFKFASGILEVVLAGVKVNGPHDEAGTVNKILGLRNRVKVRVVS
jgi:hypothetical protein